MGLEKYAFLLDNDNLFFENKLFIDLMWYIAENKDNGPDKEKGLVTKCKNGKYQSKYKSYIVRNAGIMFQQLFYWHFKYIKKNKNTKYQYNNQGQKINTIKKDFDDWWSDLRITAKDITSANKFLKDTGLLDIKIMRIKSFKDDDKEKVIYKPSNCYILNLDLLEKYLDKLVDINKEVYAQKVLKIKKKNFRPYKLSTEKSVHPVTVRTLEQQGLRCVNEDLSTISTLSTTGFNSVHPVTGCTKVNPVTGCTKVNPVTECTKVNPVTEFTNKSYITDKDNIQSIQDREEAQNSPSPLSVEDIWINCKSILKTKISQIAYNTWIESLKVANSQQEGCMELIAPNNFTKGIIESKYFLLIEEAAKIVSTNKHLKVTIDY